MGHGLNSFTKHCQIGFNTLHDTSGPNFVVSVWEKKKNMFIFFLWEQISGGFLGLM